MLRSQAFATSGSLGWWRVQTSKRNAVDELPIGKMPEDYAEQRLGAKSMKAPITGKVRPIQMKFIKKEKDENGADQ